MVHLYNAQSLSLSLFIISIHILTLSSLQINTDTFANSADPDEMARYEPSHQDLHCLPLCF